MDVTAYPYARARARSSTSPRLLALLRPVPLAFLLFPFAFAAQVVTQDERVGAVPYALLFIGMSGALLRRFPWTRRDPRTGGTMLDFAVGLFAAFSAIQIAVGFALGSYSLATAARWLLINVGSAGVYYHVTRFATRSEIRAVLLAVSLSAMIVGVEWIYETYTKMVLQEVSDYQRMSAEYTKRRQNLSEEEMNPSGIGVQYRAHGLVEKHTSTGATVAIGAFASVALFPLMRRTSLVLTLIAFLIVLSIGQATTAWLVYVFTASLALYFLADRRRALGQLRRGVTYGALALGVLLTVGSSIQVTRDLIAKILETVELQTAAIVNLDPESGRMSFVWLYIQNISSYLASVFDNPLTLLVGQGPESAGPTAYARGGDVGWLETVAVYGVPMSILFFGVCCRSVLRAFRALRRPDLDATARAQLMFGAAVVTLLVLSLMHYDVLFKKSLFVCFFLGLGLIRRHLPPVRTTFSASRA